MAEAQIQEMPEDPSMYDQNVQGALIQNRGEEATVDFAPGAARVSPEDSAEHSANLVSLIDESELGNLAMRVIDAYDADVRSRADWQGRMDQALELLGLRNRSSIRSLPRPACSFRPAP